MRSAQNALLPSVLIVGPGREPTRLARAYRAAGVDAVTPRGFDRKGLADLLLNSVTVVATCPGWERDPAAAVLVDVAEDVMAVPVWDAVEFGMLAGMTAAALGG